MCANFRRTQRRYFIQIRLIVGFLNQPNNDQQLYKVLRSIN